jgi:hypothetical protein
MVDRPDSRLAPIDPTKNVLDLVRAESKYQDAMRVAEDKYQNALREAEMRRINELAIQKQTFDLELAKVLRANQDAASTLLATQLKEVKTDLSDRTSKLEQVRDQNVGKSEGVSGLSSFIGQAVLIVVAIVGAYFASRH